MAEKILVVDDEAQVREMLTEFLREHGYEVIEAADGGEALTKAMNERPNAVVLDLRMPGLDGLETCRALKGRQATSSVPVMVATGYFEHIIEAFEAGADEFVDKPFHLEDMLHKLRALLVANRESSHLDRSVRYMVTMERRRLQS